VIKHCTLEEVHEDLLRQLRLAEDARDRTRQTELGFEKVRHALTCFEEGDYEPAWNLYDEAISRRNTLVGEWQPSNTDLQQKVTDQEAIADKSGRKRLIRLLQLREVFRGLDPECVDDEMGRRLKDSTITGGYVPGTSREAVLLYKHLLECRSCRLWVRLDSLLLEALAQRP